MLFPTGCLPDGNARSLSSWVDLPPVPGKRQSLMAAAKGHYRALLFCRHSWQGQVHERTLRLTDFPITDFPSRARSLLTRKFRVAIPGTIGFRPFDCAFRD